MKIQDGRRHLNKQNSSIKTVGVESKLEFCRVKTHFFSLCGIFFPFRGYIMKTCLKILRHQISRRARFFSFLRHFQ